MSQDFAGTSDGEAEALLNIDDDLDLPLTERYFLGGIGAFQLRGYRARSVGPRRAVLRRAGLFGSAARGCEDSRRQGRRRTDPPEQSVPQNFLV